MSKMTIDLSELNLEEMLEVHNALAAAARERGKQADLERLPSMKAKLLNLSNVLTEVAEQADACLREAARRAGYTEIG